MTSVPLPDPIFLPVWAAAAWQKDRLIERAIRERPGWYEDKVLARLSEPRGEHGCTEWTASRSKGGYGQVVLPKSVARGSNGAIPANVHRVRFLAEIGQVAYGLTLDHMVCDNPPCTDPGHLQPVTNVENIMRVSSAQRPRQTHCAAGLHELVLRPDGSRRECPSCRRAKDAVYNALRAEAVTRTGLTRERLVDEYGKSLDTLTGLVVENGGDPAESVARRAGSARLGLAAMMDGALGSLARRALLLVVSAPHV